MTAPLRISEMVIATISSTKEKPAARFTGWSPA
jgi:hypothetical protein